jgi:hypothetical protein
MIIKEKLSEAWEALYKHPRTFILLGALLASPLYGPKACSSITERAKRIIHRDIEKQREPKENPLEKQVAEISKKEESQETPSKYTLSRIELHEGRFRYSTPDNHERLKIKSPIEFNEKKEYKVEEREIGGEKYFLVRHPKGKIKIEGEYLEFVLIKNNDQTKITLNQETGKVDFSGEVYVQREKN